VCDVGADRGLIGNLLPPSRSAIASASVAATPVRISWRPVAGSMPPKIRS
jgi:hypothetical protein